MKLKPETRKNLMSIFETGTKYINWNWRLARPSPDCFRCMRFHVVEDSCGGVGGRLRTGTCATRRLSVQ